MKSPIAVGARRAARYLVLMAILAAWGVLIAQEVIENPAKPSARGAGRTLKLTEIWRITDEGGEFYFQFPYHLQAADDGSIFLADRKELLKFSQDGKFLKNLYKKGQGPGEIGDDFSFCVFGRDIFIQEYPSQRFWRTDLEGVFQEQITLANKDYGGFLGVLPDGFLFLKTVWPPPSERTGKLMEILHIIAFVRRDGSERKDVATFRPRDFLAPQAATSMSAKITALSPDGKLLYAFHGRDYLIEVVDLAAATVVKRYTRAYPKVSYTEKGWESNFRKRFNSPKLEYEIDVKDLYPVGDRLWVETSTDDKTKGRLIDVFDKDGRFLDSFYLGAGRALMAVREDDVFCLEKNEDESLTIVKYRIER
jgi:hypothetical protein